MSSAQVITVALVWGVWAALWFGTLPLAWDRDDQVSVLPEGRRARIRRAGEFAGGAVACAAGVALIALYRADAPLGDFLIVILIAPPAAGSAAMLVITVIGIHQAR